MSFQSEMFSSLKGPLFTFSVFFSSHCECLRETFFLLSAFIWFLHSPFHQAKMFLQYSWIQQQPRSGCRVLFCYCFSCWSPCSTRDYNHILEFNGLKVAGGVVVVKEFFCVRFFLWVEDASCGGGVLYTYAWRKKHSEHDRLLLILALLHEYLPILGQNYIWYIWVWKLVTKICEEFEG